MKLEIVDDYYLFFTNDIGYLDDDLSEENVSEFLKRVFLAISDIYEIDLFGFFQVDIHIDKKIGAYIEISKKDEYISYGKKIDTKVSLIIDNFYLKTKDVSKIINYHPIYYDNDYYYVSTDSVENLFDLLEFCDIEYKNLDLKTLYI